MNHYENQYSNRYNDEPETIGCLSYLGGILLVVAFMYAVSQLFISN